MLKKFLEDAQDFNAIKDISSPEIANYSGKFYVGIDPTAESLQLGNLIPLVFSMRLGQAGLEPIILLGGSTSQIGDPAGKNQERPLLELDQLEKNRQSIEASIQSLFTRQNIVYTLVNNYDWTHSVSILDFLRDIGKYLSVNYMLAKDTVKNRINDSGISLTEFCYMALQGFDFYHLYVNEKCQLQIGGSDQWGNITAGIEVIRKKTRNEGYGLSFPLLTDKSGKKFGKSEKGTFWLDPNKTPPIEIYQYLFNTEDELIAELLFKLTLLPVDFIRAKVQEAQEIGLEKRTLNKLLAREVLKLVHGEEVARAAEQENELLFSKSAVDLSQAEIHSHSAEDTIIEVLLKLNFASSRGSAKDLIKGRGVKIDEQVVEESQTNVPIGTFLECNTPKKLSVGKRKVAIIQIH